MTFSFYFFWGEVLISAEIESAGIGPGGIIGGLCRIFLPDFFETTADDTRIDIPGPVQGMDKWEFIRNDRNGIAAHCPGACCRSVEFELLMFEIQRAIDMELDPERVNVHCAGEIRDPGTFPFGEQYIGKCDLSGIGLWFTDRRAGRRDLRGCLLTCQQKKQKREHFHDG